MILCRFFYWRPSKFDKRCHIRRSWKTGDDWMQKFVVASRSDVVVQGQLNIDVPGQFNIVVRDNFILLYKKVLHCCTGTILFYYTGTIWYYCTGRFCTAIQGQFDTNVQDNLVLLYRTILYYCTGTICTAEQTHTHTNHKIRCLDLKKFARTKWQCWCSDDDLLFLGRCKCKQWSPSNCNWDCRWDR